MKKIISAALAGCALVGALAFGGVAVGQLGVHHFVTPTSGGNWPGPLEN